MLRLKRASAGSGKTYELAKTYIKLLLTYKTGKETRELRNRYSLRDSLSAIMAVTFTVKATAEMKERIIEKLSELAQADTADEEKLKEISYLKEFEEDLGLERNKIAELARSALKEVLLHYSDFKVQTIDSFFQNILHTFAFEASLDENFNMELDSDFVSSVGLDSALDEISEKPADPSGANETLFWLRQLMGDKVGSYGWNVFTRKSDEMQLYALLVKQAKNLEKENFQDIYDKLKIYFDSLDRPFSEVVEEVDQANMAKWEALHEKQREAAKALRDVLYGFGFQNSDLFNKHGSKLELSLKDFQGSNLTEPPKRVECGQNKKGFSLKGDTLKALKKMAKEDPSRYDSMVSAIDAAYADWMEAGNVYADEWEKDEVAINTWQFYKEMLPKLMIVLEIGRRKNEYLRVTNTLHISETNNIISRIIDGDDTPFVYERMGSILNHFLIDEFQDTSRMQWQNLRPLLLNSDSEYHDNLIIGDAKQSIYRFRNADYHLIQNLSKDSGFEEIVEYTTEYKPEASDVTTTNFRSQPRIVRMNNFLFSNLTNLNKVDKDGSPVPLFNNDVKDIYKDSIQKIPSDKIKNEPATGGGYVEFIFTKPLDAEEKKEYDDVNGTSEAEAGFRELPGLILSLRKKGYKFRDIGILVKSHIQGKVVVQVINKHNSDPANKDNLINLISQENLLVSSALSVELIIYALRLIHEGFLDRSKEKSHLPAPSEDICLPINEDELLAHIHSLNSLSLTSIVEAIIEKFLPPARRDVEAPFIAAFQDAILDYSSTRGSDIGSFLKWWKSKSNSLSITSPENEDGVKLQTIHSSKGLEHKCVIIPYANFNFEPTRLHMEWRWETPDSRIKKSNLLPPFIPLETVEQLGKTFHKNVRDKYLEDYVLDELNKMYVALTRARHELYVYFPVSKNGGYSKSGDIVCNMLRELKGEGNPLFPDILKIDDSDPDRIGISYGEVPGERQVSLLKEIEEKKNSRDIADDIKLSTYNVSSDRSVIVFKEDHEILKTNYYTGEDEELNPRAEGTLKHHVMQMINTEKDLDKALLKLKVTGLISKDEMEKWRTQLGEAIRREAHRGWFSPDVKVINERPLLYMKEGERMTCRPDRIVVDRNNDAVVIDYKFGDRNEKENAGYRRQVARYMDRLRESGQFNSIKGYLWYVSDNIVEEVKA